jgi:hypothetical protein
VEWQVGNDYDPDAVRTAIRYMYGLELPASYDIKCSWSLRCYAEVGAIAEKYEIDGLYDVIFEAANHAMAYCLGHSEALQTLLYDVMFHTPESVSGAYHYTFGIRVIREHPTELHREREFNILLIHQPKLAGIILNLLVDEKNGLVDNDDINLGEYGVYEEYRPLEEREEDMSVKKRKVKKRKVRISEERED